MGVEVADGIRVHVPDGWRLCRGKMLNGPPSRADYPLYRVPCPGESFLCPITGNALACNDIKFIQDRFILERDTPAIPKWNAPDWMLHGTYVCKDFGGEWKYTDAMPYKLKRCGIDGYCCGNGANYFFSVEGMAKALGKPMPVMPSCGHVAQAWVPWRKSESCKVGDVW